ncbi:right-handed parallel beta-helix repeat-containing protein [Treponema porcinum]|uniref:right-handed parallel beta-helix repeat-containing protein n=1 Tax=Treponema porcinum TaxID=261392 RepID=UPI003F092368
MHQTKKYLLPFFTALCAVALVFTGCANSADSIDSSDGKKEKFTITVKTQNIYSKTETEGRSIFPVLSGSEYYTLSCKSGDTWQNLDGTYPDYQMLIIPGTYTLKLDAYSDAEKKNLILTGQTELTVTSGMGSTEVPFIMQPPENATGTGNINLALSAESDTQIAAFEITTDSGNLSLGWTKDDTETSYTKGTITRASVPTGTYHLAIYGNTTTGETIYVRFETLTVWKDLTSSAWIFADGSSSNELKITASDLYSTFYVKGSSGPYNFYTSDSAFGDVTASDTNSGNVISPLQTVSAAVNKCVVSYKPYTIYVDGTVTETIDSTSPDPTAIEISGGKIITIKSIKPESERSVIQADGNGHVMFAGGTVVLEDLVLKGGNTSVDGGGIFVGSSWSLTMKNCTITDCKTTTSGAGIYVAGGSVTLTDCTFSGNTAQTGAGIYLNNGTLTISSTTMESNTATGAAGALYINNGTATLTECTVSSNNAQNGGGIYLNDGALTISSTTMENNTATATGEDNGGGAIYSKKTITFTDCTFSGNSATSGKAINFYNINSEQKLKFNGTIQTNEDDIYFATGNRFLIQTPLSTDSSILVTPSNYATGETILTVEEGVTLAEQVDYFKITPKSQSDGSFMPWIVLDNGKTMWCPKIEQLTNAPNSLTYPYVSISTVAEFGTVNDWLSSGYTFSGITLLLENDLDLTIQIPSNFAGTLNGKEHTINGTNQAYKTLFESPSADVINLNVSGYYQKPRPLTAAENVAIFTDIPAGQSETIDASTLDETDWTGAGSAEISGNVTLTATTPTTITSSGNIFTVKNGGTLTLESNVTLKTTNPLASVKVEEGGTLILDGAEITSSSTTNPTGVSITKGTLIMNSGTISSIQGSAIVATDSTITITGGTISNNSGSGSRSTLNLTNCTADIKNLTVTNNFANWYGGGIMISGGGTYTFTSCEISSNSTGYSNGVPGYGGGIYIDTTGTVTFTGCTITGNSAINNGSSSKGGGIYLNSGTLTTTGCTISSNTTKNGSTETTGYGSQIYAVAGSVYNGETLATDKVIDK